jgi:hypothetical protein
MNTKNQPSIPSELWGLWIPYPSQGEPRWLCHMHETTWGGGGPMVFFNREDAVEQAQGEYLWMWDEVVAVRILCTPDAQTPTP